MGEGDFGPEPVPTHQPCSLDGGFSVPGVSSQREGGLPTPQASALSLTAH